MVFVMDESGSITAANFEKMKNLAIDITNEFTISPTRTQVGWINFNNAARQVFTLTSYQNKASLHEAIRAIQYMNGGTNIGAGLQALYNYGFAGARETFYIPEVAIVVTDGQSDIEEIQAAAMLLHDNRDVNVFVVGVGTRVDDMQLDAIAAAGINTDLSHVYHIDDFVEEELDNLQQTIRARTCFGELIKCELVLMPWFAFFPNILCVYCFRCDVY